MSERLAAAQAEAAATIARLEQEEKVRNEHGIDLERQLALAWKNANAEADGKLRAVRGELDALRKTAAAAAAATVLAPAWALASTLARPSSSAASATGAGAAAATPGRVSRSSSNTPRRRTTAIHHKNWEFCDL